MDTSNWTVPKDTKTELYWRFTGDTFLTLEPSYIDEKYLNRIESGIPEVYTSNYDVMSALHELSSLNTNKPLQPQICTQCGAPLNGNRCDYCGTKFRNEGKDNNYPLSIQESQAMRVALDRALNK